MQKPKTQVSCPRVQGGRAAARQLARIRLPVAGETANERNRRGVAIIIVHGTTIRNLKHEEIGDDIPFTFGRLKGMTRTPGELGDRGQAMLFRKFPRCKTH